jgi:hypothetical protein
MGCNSSADRPVQPQALKDLGKDLGSAGKYVIEPDDFVHYPDADGQDIQYRFVQGKLLKVIEGRHSYTITALCVGEASADGYAHVKDQIGNGEKVSVEHLKKVRLLAERACVSIVSPSSCGEKISPRAVSTTAPTSEAENGNYAGCHLVLNMDVNKTILMADVISGKSQSDCVNQEIAAVAWGKASEAGEWALVVEELSVELPAGHGNELTTYFDWIEMKYPGSDNKKFRQKLTSTFTESGQPGMMFADKARDLESKLKRPDGSNMVLLPSFLELLAELKRRKRSFTVVFRTFGEDLEAVSQDLNHFCEGTHPMFPGVRMDGSDGQSDYRVRINDPDRCGTYHRDDASGLSVVMGTTEQPGEGKHKQCKDKSIAFYGDFPGVSIITGFEAVRDFMWAKCEKAGTLAMRDYHAYWKAKKQTAEGGKVFMFNPCLSLKQHEIFFDDNIRHEDFYIIQPISISDASRKQWPINLLRSHICRAEPYLSITDRRYFIKEVERLEEGWRKRLRAIRRCRQLLKRSAAIIRLARFRKSRQIQDESAQLRPYDAWVTLRKTDAQYAHRAEDERAEDE